MCNTYLHKILARLLRNIELLIVLTKMMFYSFVLIFLWIGICKQAETSSSDVVLVHTNLRSAFPPANERSKKVEEISNKASSSTENDTTTRIGNNVNSFIMTIYIQQNKTNIARYNYYIFILFYL